MTKDMQIHGYQPTTDCGNWRYVYGSDGDKILAMQNEHPEYAEKLHPAFDFTVAEVIWAVREEMAITVDDVLARRIRALFLDARASMEMAPKVAHIMAQELGKDASWEKDQVEKFTEVANGYIL